LEVNSVSEEHVTSIFGVKQQAKQETSMKAVGKQKTELFNINNVWHSNHEEEW
jgi:hypothetical protein